MQRMTPDAVLSATEGPPLRAAGLAKRYRRGATALEGLDVTINQGTITGLIGPNGAGKSTLIRTWIGIERPTRGSVSVCGHDPRTSRGTVLRLAGYVPQTPSRWCGPVCLGAATVPSS
jgi:ABC-2 type transport system ATP-binding protein